MVVRMVTDSSSDIPPEVARELDITVVPLYVGFGEETFRDGVDISADRFYQDLARGEVPHTSVPSPGDFTQVYQRLAESADTIVSIHLSPRYSGTLNSARLAAGYAPEGCTVHVIDSRTVSMGCGLVVLAAAREASTGAPIEKVLDVVERSVALTHIVGMISDIRYVAGGHRLSLPGWHLFLGWLGTLLRFKLVGEICEAGRVRGRGMYLREATALYKLEMAVMEREDIAEIAVVHAMKPDWASSISARLTEAFPGVRVHVSRLSAATGVHGGPNAVAIAFIEKAPVR
jgi:DegV family protein with EDD domain